MASIWGWREASWEEVVFELSLGRLAEGQCLGVSEGGEKEEGRHKP